MPTNKEMYEDALRGNERVVTAPHTQWLQTPEEQQVYSEEAITFMAKSLRREFKHERPGRFSPSAMGKCSRRVLFGFAGAPAEQPNIDNQEMMDHGTWTHLKWQTEGLTMGYMKECEAWEHSNDLLTGGSIDAILMDDSVFELKSAGQFVYSKIVSVDGWPQWENLLQLHTYFLLKDVDVGSLVMENRSSGQFHEFRIHRDADVEKQVLRLLVSYRRYVEDDSLPDMLEMCAAGKGDVFRRCPYRAICAGAETISQFGHVK